MSGSRSSFEGAKLASLRRSFMCSQRAASKRIVTVKEVCVGFSTVR
jgi:hypothetical protein